MDTSTASVIEIEALAHDRAAHAVIEIGPYDLPEPPGGWVELFQDDGDGERDRVAPSAAIPLAQPAARDERGGAARSSPSRARARRWVLLPEALVVAAFVLFGVAFAAIVVRVRGSASPAAGSSVSAAAEVSDPTPFAAGRRHARPSTPIRSRWDPEPPSAAAPDGPDGAPPGSFAPAALDAPPVGGSPLDPEAPPSPSLAPFSG